MGGRSMITYTLQEESGCEFKSMLAYKIIGETNTDKNHKGWTTRPGREWQPVTGQAKFKWEKRLNYWPTCNTCSAKSIRS
jgi:hypothetical protein